MTTEPSVYEVVGGERFFVALVDRFYDGVEHDELLRPLYPDDLTDSRRYLAGFLAQYWGGPPDYSQERGHPRPRMRHLPFAIGEAERDAWLHHMLAALEAEPPPVAPSGRLLSVTVYDDAMNVIGSDLHGAILSELQEGLYYAEVAFWESAPAGVEAVRYSLVLDGHGHACE